MQLRPSWSWLYGSWIYNYLCNQCLSPLTLWVPISLRRCILNTTFDYVLKLVSDLREVGGFLWVLRLPQPIKLTATYDITEILLKVALNTITHPHPIQFVFSSRYIQGCHWLQKMHKTFIWFPLIKINEFDSTGVFWI